MKINKKEFVDARIKLIDSATQLPIEDAVFSNIVLISSDPLIVSIEDINNDAEADIVGVSEGTATITVKATVSYTDNEGITQTVDKEKTAEVTVSKDPQLTELVVSFTDAQAIPEL